MDCQGLYDLTSNYEAIDAIVTLCGLKMSKVHLMNIKGDINANELTHLKVIAQYQFGIFLTLREFTLSNLEAIFYAEINVALFYVRCHFIKVTYR